MPDQFYMQIALAEAERAGQKDEVPVGAVMVHRGEIVGRGHNRREELQSPIAHAEIAAIEQAAARLRSWRLEECTLFVTLEPCIMCVGAIVQARIARVVFGCLDPKGGAVESLYRALENPRLNHHPQITRGVLESECAGILTDFFAGLRARKQSASGT